jgi:uncharacterized membrane protein
MLTGSLTEVFVAAAVFVAGHFLISSTAARPWLVARLGERGYLGAFSLLALSALIWLVWSYRNAPFILWWPPLPGARHLALTLMPLALTWMIGSFRKDNPGTAASTDMAPEKLGIFAVTRHPLMWAIVLWATLHLLANGDAAGTILFGAMLVLAGMGSFAIDSKLSAHAPETFTALAAHTSNLPFAAILRGRGRFSGYKLLPAALIALGLYGALLVLHPYLFGVAVLY